MMMSATKSTAVCSPATATSKKSAWSKASNGFNTPKQRVKPSPLATTISKGANVTSLKT